METCATAITPVELTLRFPRLFHLTHLSNWPSIQQRGLLSASALLDLYQVSGTAREQLEERNRRDLVPLSHDGMEVAILRDQKPMDDRGLTRALRDGLSPTDWYKLVNRHVFFWVDRQRVERLLRARAYRAHRHLLLTVRTESFVKVHGPSIVLSPINTGATKPMPHPRGKDCFVPIASYPFLDWNAKRRGRDPVVELAVPDAVPDLMNFIESATEVGREEPEVQILAGVLP